MNNSKILEYYLTPGTSKDLQRYPDILTTNLNLVWIVKILFDGARWPEAIGLYGINQSIRKITLGENLK